MTAKKLFWVGAALAGSMAIVTSSGCDGSDSKTGAPAPAAVVDASAVGCSPNAKECVSPRLARVCPGDGAGWLSVSCGLGEVCTDGDCKLDPTAACPAGAASCVDEATALRCKSDQKGYETVTCPAGTTCQGAGQCAGACVVGSSICLDTGTVGTCADGKTYTATSCGVDQGCVKTADAPTAQAACKAAACKPLATGCRSVCGDATQPSANPTAAVSTCTETPDGWKWIVSPCATGLSCNPVGHLCAGTNHAEEAACQSECTPGSTRCSSAGNQTGVQTCGQDGKWGANAPCAATDACFRSPDDPSHAMCADPICATPGATGACVTGGIKLCDANGRVSQTVTPCAGPCSAVASGTALATPGRCIAECNAGDERCISNGSSQFQTCDNGRWSAATQCATTDAGPGLCYSMLSASGRPAKVCGAECSPGQARCASSDGGSQDALQTCDATGHWGAPSECSIGVCETQGNRSACVAECIPNTTVCTGNQRAAAGTPYQGRDAFATCTAKGRIPTAGATTCGAGLVCRTVNGQALMVGATACIECVGSGIAGGNEDGLVDTRCSNDTGDAGGVVGAQTCSAANTWVGGDVAHCSALSKNCVSGSRGSTNRVDVCRYSNGHFYNESYFASQRPFHGPTTCKCATRRCSDYGEATQCGAVSDCCSDQCTRATAGKLARCN
jgi:hypothetical protein